MTDLRLVTSRLLLIPVTAGDVPALFEVRMSNPERLLRTEGSMGQPGYYDVAMLERDIGVAYWDPNRRLLAVRRRSDDGVIGLADMLVKHPDDGLPWLGAVEIVRSEQRRGYGTEVVEAIADYAGGELRSSSMRAQVDGDDVVGERFALRCGFQRAGELKDGSLLFERRLC